MGHRLSGIEAGHVFSERMREFNDERRRKLEARERAEDQRKHLVARYAVSLAHDESVSPYLQDRFGEGPAISGDDMLAALTPKEQTYVVFAESTINDMVAGLNNA